MFPSLTADWSRSSSSNRSWTADLSFSTGRLPDKEFEDSNKTLYFLQNSPNVIFSGNPFLCRRTTSNICAPRSWIWKIVMFNWNFLIQKRIHSWAINLKLNIVPVNELKEHSSISRCCHYCLIDCLLLWYHKFQHYVGVRNNEQNAIWFF